MADINYPIANNDELTQLKLDFASQQQEIIAARQGKASLGANLTAIKDDLAQHKLDYMPHRFQDLKNDKIYKFGFRLSAEGNPQIIYEEVIE